MTALNETHDPVRKSWVESANLEGTSFPIQNLPLGVFRRRGDNAPPRCGIAVGDHIFEPARHLDLFSGPGRTAAEACAASSLNALMALGPEAWSALRLQSFRMLSAAGDRRAAIDPHLIAMQEAELLLPAQIGNFTDFFASIHHATNVGRLFRPDNPLLPNYKYVPIAYHGRASSLRPSGVEVRRPCGQIKAAGAEVPAYESTRQLDFEAELGVLVGTGSELGTPIKIGDAGRHVFGLCLLNDWSARDIQAWESQPLGPFLAKSFATTLSPWMVTAEALAPFRTAASTRPAGDPQPLPHLDDPRDRESGGLAIVVETHLATAAMRGRGAQPLLVSRAPFAGSYWTIAQMIAHHTSNGCNLEIGDLIGTGTISGADPGSWSSLLELTARGTKPLLLPDGETRTFLEDGDEVILRARCEKPGYAGIGFGECRATVIPHAAVR